MKVLTRFAPSPTGFLHVGNARAALFCKLFAAAHGGRFLLRFDDTDAERSKPEFAEAIAEDLDWLGLKPDDTAYQSARAEAYEAAFETLKKEARIYPCFETPDELERKRKRQRARGLPPVYDRAALELTDDDRRALEAEGRAAHWRFRLSGEAVAWEDGIRGTQSIDTSSVSDPVIRRADGTWLYTLPSVVDDLEFGVSHVLRGEDHVTNTAAQIEIIDALDGAPPVFAHFSLLLDAEGGALSKREGSSAVRDLRAEGIEPMALNALLARLGTADAVEAVGNLDALAAQFDLSRLGRAPARFDPADVLRLNTRLIHEMDFADAAPRLAALDAPDDEAFWEAVRGNLARFSDVAEWAQIIRDPVSPVIAAEDSDFIAAARDCLPPAPLDETSWETWTAELKEKTGRRGKALFMPLRHALTGREHGPEMKNLLPLIGHDKVILRLSGRSER